MKIRTILFLLALTATSAAPAAAQPPGLFGEFKTLCLDVNGGPDAHMAAADGSGWQPVAKPWTGAVARGEKARMKLRPDGAVIIKASRIRAGKESYNNCSLVVFPADPELEAAAGAWAGVKPDKTEPGALLYSFIDSSKGHRSMDKLEGLDMLEMLQKHQMLMVRTLPKSTVVEIAKQIPPHG